MMRSLELLLAGSLLVFISTACSAQPTPEPTRLVQPTTAPQPTLTIAPPAAPATSTATPLPVATAVAPSSTQSPATATIQLTVAAPSTATATSIPLLSAPLLVQPAPRASFASNAPVILMWTFERALQPDEYFQIQLARADAEPKDFGCIPATTYVIAQPPLGYGSYQWRVIARRGKAQGDQCTPQADLSSPSETRIFEWRTPTEPPTPRPYP